MTKDIEPNGGGYGHTGADAPLRAEAQQQPGKTLRTDGSVDVLAGATNNDSLSRPTAHNGQSQIGYTPEHDEEE